MCVYLSVFRPKSGLNRSIKRYVPGTLFNLGSRIMPSLTSEYSISHGDIPVISDFGAPIQTKTFRCSRVLSFLQSFLRAYERSLLCANFSRHRTRILTKGNLACALSLRTPSRQVRGSVSDCGPGGRGAGLRSKLLFIGAFETTILGLPHQQTVLSGVTCIVLRVFLRPK